MVLTPRRYNRHGATDDELAMSMPGDELVPRPKLGYTRAITIDAAPTEVWKWLVQIGQGRAGLYSYDWLENLVGCKIRSATAVIAEHQHLEVGDIIRSGPDHFPCWAVMQVDVPESLVLLGAGTPEKVEIPEPLDELPPTGYAAATWQWLLQPRADNTQTRVVVRQRLTYSPRQAAVWHIVEPINFVMERKMLRGMKERAETNVTSPVG